MIYNGAPILPLRDGYVPAIPYGSQTLTLPGGLSQVRRTVVKPITTVSAQYLLTSCFMISWYKAWYRRVALEGGAQFTARLAVDNTLYADYTVQFVKPPTITHNGYRGLLSCEYEVLNRGDGSDNCDYLAVYDALGNCTKCAIQELNDAIEL